MFISRSWRLPVVVVDLGRKMSDESLSTDDGRNNPYAHTHTHTHTHTQRISRVTGIHLSARWGLRRRQVAVAAQQSAGASEDSCDFVLRKDLGVLTRICASTPFPSSAFFTTSRNAASSSMIRARSQCCATSTSECRPRQRGGEAEECLAGHLGHETPWPPTAICNFICVVSAARVAGVS